MESITAELRHKLIADLNKLIKHTESIYLNLAGQYPELLKEMETSLEYSDSMISSFGNGSGGTSLHSGGINTVIQQTRAVIEEASSDFTIMHERDEALFSSLNTGIGKLSSLDEVIERIREDSIEMEIISLNAMTVALKAGTAGKAFSYITDELKRLSTRTIGFTENLTDRGKHLLTLFYQFRTDVESVKNLQENVFGEFRKRILESFDRFNTGLESIVSAISTIKDESKQVKPPLLKIMETIQFQDIIRQSLDHVIISVNSLQESRENRDDEFLLDELSFFQALPELANSLLDYVSEEIRNCLEQFDQHAREANAVISNVDARRKTYISQMTENKEHNGKSIHALFEDSAHILKSLISDIQKAMRMKDKISEDGRRLMKEVKAMEDSFKAFSTLISRFQSIDIASRIEVAKQEVLRDMKGTVTEMTALTERIEDDVKTALSATKQFIKATHSTITDYTNIFKQEEIVVSRFEENIQKSYENLFQAEDELINTITGFSLYTNRFFSLFESTARDLEGLRTLLTDIQAIKHELRNVKERAAKKMQTLLSSKGIKNWSLKSEKLKEMIEKFTIFTHKKTAGDIAGFEVEGGNEAGEITFF